MCATMRSAWSYRQCRLQALTLMDMTSGSASTCRRWGHAAGAETVIAVLNETLIEVERLQCQRESINEDCSPGFGVRFGLGRLELPALASTVMTGAIALSRAAALFCVEQEKRSNNPRYQAIGNLDAIGGPLSAWCGG